VAAPGAEPEKCAKGAREPRTVSRREGAPDLWRQFRFRSIFSMWPRIGGLRLLKHPTYRLLYALLARRPLGQFYGSDFAQSGAPRHRAPRCGRDRFPKAPGSRSRMPGLRTGPTGRRTGRTLTFPPGEMDISACGASDRRGFTHRPAGEPLRVWHFHGRAFYHQDGWSTGAGRIAIVLREGYGEHLADDALWRALRGGAQHLGTPGSTLSLQARMPLFNASLIEQALLSRGNRIRIVFM